MKPTIVVIVFLLLTSCKSESNKKTIQSVLGAQEIVDKSLSISGGENFKSSRITFKFRDYFYAAIRRGGDYSLSRIKDKEGDSIIDILSNEGFSRFINNEFQDIPDSTGQKYAASVNSVHYFSVLPYGLNDAAVNKKSLGETNIKGKTYFKIRVTFNAEGGGEDYEDVFIYWIDKQNFKVDYLAYSYAEEHGVGLRFREAYNERYINGLRFVDYNNYKPKNENVALDSLDLYFSKGELDLLSKIELENVQVKLFDLK